MKRFLKKYWAWLVFAILLLIKITTEVLNPEVTVIEVMPERFVLSIFFFLLGMCSEHHRK